MPTQEVFIRAGSLTNARPVSLDRNLDSFERIEGIGEALMRGFAGRSGEVLFVFSNSGVNPLPIEVALDGKRRGLFTIGVTSMEHSQRSTPKHSSGKRLHEVVDLAIDTHVPYGDVGLEVEGLPMRIGPLSTIAGVAIINAVMAETIEAVMAAGEAPPVRISRNTPDGMEKIIQSSGNQVRIVTLAPEMPGALDLIRYLAGKGIAASIGHSSASIEQVLAAAEAGLRRATHLYNGMTGFDHRAPGAVGAVLCLDEVYAELIIDGAHVHPAAAKIALRCKGPERIVLVTDSTQAAGLGEGEYIRPGNRKIIVKNGTARLESGALAGSVLSLNQAVANAQRFMGISLPVALALATRVAAESVGLHGRKGSLAAGKDADPPPPPPQQPPKTLITN
jgi:uncharacterized phosphosugar-binding protein